MLTDEAGHKLHRWHDVDGNEWACAVYDHGPFCRLCQPCDGTLSALLENVAEGRMTFKQDPNGEFRFRLTEAGQQAAADLISTIGMEDQFDGPDAEGRASEGAE